MLNFFHFCFNILKFFIQIVSYSIFVIKRIFRTPLQQPGRVTYWTSFDGVKDYKEAFDDAIGLKPIRNDHESNGHLVYPVCEEKSAISYINCDRECNTYGWCHEHHILIAYRWILLFNCFEFHASTRYIESYCTILNLSVAYDWYLVCMCLHK